MATLAILAGLLTGCATRPAGQVVVDRQVGVSRRVAALNRLGRPTPKRRALLGAIAWSDREPRVLRMAAFNALAEADEHAFVTTLNRRITQIDRWPVLRRVLELAAGHGWRGATGGIVRSWARPSTTYADGDAAADRPERMAIAALYPGRGVQDVLLGLLAAPAGGASETTLPERVAAWTVLSRLNEPDDLRALLSSLPPMTPLVEDLRAAAGVLDVLPSDREAVLWLTVLRGREGGDWWREAAARVAALTPAQREGLRLRHLPLLMAVEQERLRVDRQALSAWIGDRLSRSPHVTRTDSGSTGEPVSEMFADHAATLAWGDLLAIGLVLDAMEAGRLTRQWFVQADADRLDTSTELGGVLRFDGDGGTAWRAALFPPVLWDHDRKFYSSPDLIASMYTGIAHYHFHAQNHDNARFAGPGAGDFAFADRLRPNAIVLTFTDRSTLNVDYYLPGHIVIDLGTIHR